MNETPAAAVAVGAASAAALCPGVPADVVIGAFAGAVLFVVAADDIDLRRKAVLFIASIIVAVLGADSVSRIAEATFRVETVDPAVSAVLIGAMVVWLMQFFVHRLRGGGPLPTLPNHKRNRIDDPDLH